MQRRRRPIRFSNRRLEPLEPRLLLIGPGDDVGDTRALSVPLAYTYGLAGTFADEVGQPGDVDVFRLDLQAGDRVDLRLESTSTGEFPFFGLLRLFGEAEGIDQPEDHQLSFTASANGALHAGVSGFGNDQYDPDQFAEQGPPFTGDYRLEFTVTAGTVETPDDTLAGAQEMELAAGGTQTVSAQINPALDVDIVAVQLAAGDVLRAKLDSGNATVRLFDVDGQELSYDPCLQAGPGETAITAQRAGLHYVAVSGAGNSTYDPRVANSGSPGAVGDYQLTLARETRAPFGDGDTLATARQLCYATDTLPRELTVAGEIATPSNVDLFRVDLAAGEAIEATVQTGSASILNSVLRVFDATGRPVKDNLAAIDAGSENPPLRFGNAVGGTFYVGVSAVGNAACDPTSVNGLAGQSFGSYSLLARITVAGPGDGELPPDEQTPITPPRPVLPAETVTGEQLASREEVDALPLTVTAPSRLDARAMIASGTPAGVSLTLSDEVGNTILVSAPGDAMLSQHLAPGNYLLSVRAGAVAALPLDYQLITRLTPATSVLADYVSAEGVSALATGDFTGDGLIDAVLANGLEDTLLFLVGLGDGTFTPQTPFTLADAPSALAVADFNGDGRLDLAVGRRDSDRMTLFLGGASGWFDSAREVIVGAGVNALAVADFNGDGVTDLAAAVGATRSVVIVSGLQTSTDPSVTAIQLAEAASALATGDFNHDGRLDIAASLRGLDQVAILVQNASSGFTSSTIAVGDEPSDIAAGDFDGDGDLDLAAGLASDGNVTLLRNAGNAAFVAESVVVELDRAVATAGTALRAVVHAGDFNGDGRLDLAVGQTFADEVAILSMDAAGQFFTTSRTLVSRAIVALDAADLNGDGRLDLLAANDDGEAHGLAVRLGRGNGSFQYFARLAVGSDPHALATADFNSDGRLDLVTTSFAGMSIQLGAGDGAFLAERRFAADQPQAVVAGDFNRDGRPDLAATFPFRGANSEVDRRVGVWLGLGDGNFRDAVFYTVGELPLDLVAGDFNSDGIADLATANGLSNDVSVLLGAGDGTFTSAATLAAGAQPIAITSADVDRDGQFDLIVANELSDNVTIWHGAGNGQFTRRVDVNVGDAPIDILAVDLDGDGRVDQVSANRTGNSLTTLYQEPGGAFSAQTVALDGSPRGLVFLAAPGGSAPRLAVTLEDQGRVVIMERTAARQWLPASEYATGDTPIALATADLNQDGRDDLAALNAFTHDLTLLFAAGGNAFQSPSDSNRELTQATPAFADVNADGTLDALVVRQSGEVLLRYGRPETPGVFDAPLAINPAARPALSAVAIATSDGAAIATLDRMSDTLSIYRFTVGGVWTLASEIALDATSLRLVAGDINGDGLSDLAVAQVGSIALYTATSSGIWQSTAIDTGVASPAEMAIFDADSNGSADLVLADGFAGTVQLYRSAGNGTFLPPLVYRTGRGPYEFTAAASAASLRALSDTTSQMLRSFEGTSSFTFGNFDGDALPDLLVLNSGANTFALLTGQGAD
ncbi:MAG: VCBS repeat-containing protein, partial [Planctomycetia bacterium]|nr:VCBS repeat-containing protein [Planctomycetia bacterium]